MVFQLSRRPAAIIGAIIRVPCHVVKSQQRLWRSGTRRGNLRKPDLQMAWLDLTHLPLVPHICVSELGQHLFR